MSVEENLEEDSLEVPKTDDPKVEVIFDPVLKCYYDPVNNSYYELKKWFTNNKQLSKHLLHHHLVRLLLHRWNRLEYQIDHL